MRHTRIVVSHYGGPDELRVVEEGCPEPRDGDVRVKVLAAGVSLPDLLMREGVHPETPPLPFTPGWDLVGVVDRLGAAAARWLKRIRPALFRQDLSALFDLLQQHKIKPLVAQRFPLVEARRAHELLGRGGVVGKLVLVCNGSSLEPSRP